MMNKIREAIDHGMKGGSKEDLKTAEHAVIELLRSPSILKDSSKSDILEAAFRDGSSVVCSNCGGLIKRDRWTNHVQFWCNVEEGEGDDGGEGNDEGEGNNNGQEEEFFDTRGDEMDLT